MTDEKHPMAWSGIGPLLLIFLVGVAGLIVAGFITVIPPTTDTDFWSCINMNGNEINPDPALCNASCSASSNNLHMQAHYDEVCRCCNSRGIDYRNAAPYQEKVEIVSGPGAGTDITAEYLNASKDSGRECTAGDRYNNWTRYTCLKTITKNVTEAERGRGADTKATEYFGYSFIYDNATFPLETNKLYLIVHDNQIGYCHGYGKILSATLVSDYCDECTQEPGGVRLMGCCAKVGCKVDG